MAEVSLRRRCEPDDSYLKARIKQWFQRAVQKTFNYGTESGALRLRKDYELELCKVLSEISNVRRFRRAREAIWNSMNELNVILPRVELKSLIRAVDSDDLTRVKSWIENLPLDGSIVLDSGVFVPNPDYVLDQIFQENDVSKPAAFMAKFYHVSRKVQPPFDTYIRDQLAKRFVLLPPDVHSALSLSEDKDKKKEKDLRSNSDSSSYTKSTTGSGSGSSHRSRHRIMTRLAKNLVLFRPMNATIPSAVDVDSLLGFGTYTNFHNFVMHYFKENDLSTVAEAYCAWYQLYKVSAETFGDASAFQRLPLAPSKRYIAKLAYSNADTALAAAMFMPYDPESEAGEGKDERGPMGVFSFLNQAQWSRIRHTEYLDKFLRVIEKDFRAENLIVRAVGDMAYCHARLDVICSEGIQEAVGGTSLHELLTDYITKTKRKSMNVGNFLRNSEIGESLEISSKFGLADILGVTPPALSSTPLSGTPLSGTPPMGTPPGGAPGGVSIGRRKRRGKGTMSRTAVLSSMVLPPVLSSLFGKMGSIGLLESPDATLAKSIDLLATRRVLQNFDAESDLEGMGSQKDTKIRLFIKKVFKEIPNALRSFQVALNLGYRDFPDIFKGKFQTQPPSWLICDLFLSAGRCLKYLRYSEDPNSKDGNENSGSSARKFKNFGSSSRQKKQISKSSEKQTIQKLLDEAFLDSQVLLKEIYTLSRFKPYSLSEIETKAPALHTLFKVLKTGGLKRSGVSPFRRRAILALIIALGVVYNVEIIEKSLSIRTKQQLGRSAKTIEMSFSTLCGLPYAHMVHRLLLRNQEYQTDKTIGTNSAKNLIGDQTVSSLLKLRPPPSKNPTLSLEQAMAYSILKKALEKSFDPLLTLTAHTLGARSEDCFVVWAALSEQRYPQWQVLRDNMGDERPGVIVEPLEGEEADTDAPLVFNTDVESPTPTFDEEGKIVEPEPKNSKKPKKVTALDMYSVISEIGREEADDGTLYIIHKYGKSLAKEAGTEYMTRLPRPADIIGKTAQWKLVLDEKAGMLGERCVFTAPNDFHAIVLRLCREGRLRVLERGLEIFYPLSPLLHAVRFAICFSQRRFITGGKNLKKLTRKILPPNPVSAANADLKEYDDLTERLSLAAEELR
ncbi:hypothetical protein AAMO2058_000946500, partial [Amorphochlora amoebiformis]